MHKLYTVLILTFAFAFALVGCDSTGSNTEEPERDILFEQTFDSNTDGWITDAISGSNGWCGDIAQFGADGGPAMPSDGSGYAAAEHGACNDYWVEAGFPSSGPFGPFGESNDEVGFDSDNNGFVKELDIYLDPSWAAPDTSVFTYAVSFDLLDTEYPDNFRYFFVPVTKPNETLLVAGEEVSTAGWYTFRHRFTSANGSLAVDFELLRGEEVMASQPVTTTTQSQESTSSFEVSNVGTGYAWFVAIQPDLQVPIDEHTLFRVQ